MASPTAVHHCSPSLMQALFPCTTERVLKVCETRKCIKATLGHLHMFTSISIVQAAQRPHDYVQRIDASIEMLATIPLAWQFPLFITCGGG